MFFYNLSIDQWVGILSLLLSNLTLASSFCADNEWPLLIYHQITLKCLKLYTWVQSNIRALKVQVCVKIPVWQLFSCICDLVTWPQASFSCKKRGQLSEWCHAAITIMTIIVINSVSNGTYSSNYSNNDVFLVQSSNVTGKQPCHSKLFLDS